MNLSDLNPLVAIGGKILDRVLPDPAAAAAAKAELDKLAQEGELAKMANETKLYETEQNNLTQRMQADMGSDSWLSKNIRPMTLIFLLAAYSGFAIASIFEYETRGAYVELLGQWGMLVMSFYFGGRTMEKIADKVKK
jgi:Holin of 3TMs, for gene-transfer release